MSETQLISDWPTYARIPRWVLRSTELGVHAKVVYAVLEDYADTAGVAFPSKATIAANAGCSERTVHNALAELRQAGAVEIFDERFRGRGNRYILRHAPPDEEPERSAPHADSAPPAETDPAPDAQSAPDADQIGTTRSRDRHEVPEKKNQEEEPPNQNQVTAPDARRALHDEPLPPAPGERPAANLQHLDFESWWDIYPKQVARDAARKAWKKATTRTAPADLLIATMRWRDHWFESDTELRFIPKPQVFLNDGYWRDPPPAATETSLEERARARQAARVAQ